MAADEAKRSATTPACRAVAASDASVRIHSARGSAAGAAALALARWRGGRRRRRRAGGRDCGGLERRGGDVMEPLHRVVVDGEEDVLAVVHVAPKSLTPSTSSFFSSSSSSKLARSSPGRRSVAACALSPTKAAFATRSCAHARTLAESNAAPLFLVSASE